MANGTGEINTGFNSPSAQIGVIGAFAQFYGMLEQGKMAEIQAARERMYREFNLWVADQAGEEVVAASQRQALEERRQAGLHVSRALAVAAASGGGVSDPTMVDMLSRMEGEGGYRARVALYEGEAQRRAMKLQAAGGGNFDATASIRAGYNAAAFGNLARSGMTLYARYGGNGPAGGGSGDSALIMDAGTPDTSPLA